MNRRGFAKGLLGGLVGVVGAVATKSYEPLAGEIEPTTNLPAKKNEWDDCTVGGSGFLLINCTVVDPSDHYHTWESGIFKYE